MAIQHTQYLTTVAFMFCLWNTSNLHAMEVTNSPFQLFTYAKNEDWNNFTSKLADYTGNINILDDNNHSLLHYACLSNEPKNVHYCIRQEAFVNTENPLIFIPKNKVATPLHYAAHKGNDEIIGILLDAGANINSTYNEYNNTALHITVWFRHHSCATLLISRGAFLDITNCHGSTPVHSAAWQNESEILQELLKKGAHFCSKNTTGSGNTPLFLAAKTGSVECLHILLEHINNNLEHIDLECSGDNATALQVAASRNRPQCYWDLVVAGANYTKKRLYLQSLRNNSEMVDNYVPFKRFMQTIEDYGKHYAPTFKGIYDHCLLCTQDFKHNDVILTIKPCQQTFHSSCFEDYSIEYFMKNNKNNTALITFKKNDSDKEVAHRLKTSPFGLIELAKECPQCEHTVNLAASSLSVFGK